MKQVQNILIFYLMISFHFMSAQNRTITGYGNNLNNPSWGNPGDAMIWNSTIDFEDGYSSPAGQNRKSARVLSNTIFAQDKLINEPMGFSDFNIAFGQFIDHEVTLVRESATEPLNIEVPISDPWFDPNGTGEAFIPLLRCEYQEGSGEGPGNPRLYPNSVTAFIDGSAIYGSNEHTANWIRTFVNGKLRTSRGNLLPFNTITGEFEAPIDPGAPVLEYRPSNFKGFIAGDTRLNQNLLLISMHTIWMREHNRQCDIIKSRNPGWTDEQIYQKARKIVGGIQQSIVYNEWLPSLGVDLTAYAGYDPSVKPQIFNVFSAAALRYGHTILNSNIARLNEFGHILDAGNLKLKDCFFKPEMILETEGIDVYIKGMCHQTHQALDARVMDDLRNFLFGQPGSGGLDLVALNIQRGRDRGITDFNTLREDFGLPGLSGFDQISQDPQTVQQLYNAYDGNIHNIDAWVGLLAEYRTSGKFFGQTLDRIMQAQFEQLRDGDRFFYLIDEGLTQEEKDMISQTRLADLINRNSDIAEMTGNLFYAIAPPDEVRTINGMDNNPDKPDWASAKSLLNHDLPLVYADSISSPAAPTRRNEREISNIVFDQVEEMPNKNGLSSFVFAFGQLLDHDFALTPLNKEPLNIPVPKFDPFFDPQGTGTAMIPSFRSEFVPGSGTSSSNPRKFNNAITGFIDASFVYGSDYKTTRWIRAYFDGKLRTSTGNMLPYNTVDGEYGSPVDPNAPHMDRAIVPPDGKWFVAGDSRANEQPVLASMHTLFVREHNRICDELKIQHPDWVDEQLFQHARRLLIGYVSNIVYHEWLPVLGIHLPAYTGYRQDVNPQVTNLFTAAAFRFGHTMVNPVIERIDTDCEVHEKGNLNFKDVFFAPALVREVDGIEPFLTGCINKRQQETDAKVISDLRNFLFGPPGAGGMDLVALNIMRARERGIPDFNTVREHYGLDRLTGFSQISDNPETNQKLSEAYLSDINNVDVFTGILAEKHLPGSVFGELMNAVLLKQFTALRDGDRFYFENDPAFTTAEKNDIRSTKLGHIVLRNTDIECIPTEDVFYYTPVTSDEEVLVQQGQLNVFPNPGQGDFRVTVNNPVTENAILKVYNSLGQLVEHLPVTLYEGDNTLRLNLQDEAVGFYTIMLEGSKPTNSVKLVKL